MCTFNIVIKLFCQSAQWSLLEKQDLTAYKPPCLTAESTSEVHYNGNSMWYSSYIFGITNRQTNCRESKSSGNIISLTNKKYTITKASLKIFLKAIHDGDHKLHFVYQNLRTLETCL
jgi:hypothetical protein